MDIYLLAEFFENTKVSKEENYELSEIINKKIKYISALLGWELAKDKMMKLESWYKN